MASRSETLLNVSVPPDRPIELPMLADALALTDATSNVGEFVADCANPVGHTTPDKSNASHGAIIPRIMILRTFETWHP